MSDVDVLNRSALDLAALMRGGATSPEAVAEAVLAAIAAADPAIFVRVTPDRARAEAAAAGARLRAGRSRGLLDGVPVAWKDLFDMAGTVTTAGSRILAGAPPAAADAPVVARLQAAGMVAAGRVNMTEFAYSGIGLNPHYGTPVNPRSTDEPRVPGGSSSGSAAAVAAGLVPVSIGSDTGGSVRIPASLCGIVGYKATRGRYPMAGVHPLSRSLDSLGVLCRSVEDAVLVDAALTGRVASPVTRGEVSGTRILVPETVVFDDVEPEVAAAFEAALKRLETAGARIERRALPLFAEALRLYREHGAIAAAEAYAYLRPHVEGFADAMDRRVAARVALGRSIAAHDYIAVTEARRKLVPVFAAEIGDAVVAHPTTARVAPPIAALEADDGRFVAENSLMLRNTLLGNFFDGCGVTIPCGTGAAGLPAGFLLSGARGDDERLLGFALAAEAVVRPA